MIDKPKRETILGIRIVFKGELRWIQSDRDIQIPARSTGFRQKNGAHFDEESSSPALVSIRIVLGSITVLGWGACQLDMDMPYLVAAVEEGTHIELFEACRETKS